jgi:adenylosuccinate lyase
VKIGRTHLADATPLRLGQEFGGFARQLELSVERAERAADAARRGDYVGAADHLDAAEKLAPKLALIHQYRSNVAYLMGDLEGAIAALERGLELEGDNALFRVNLERLRERQ